MLETLIGATVALTADRVTKMLVARRLSPGSTGAQLPGLTIRRLDHRKRGHRTASVIITFLFACMAILAAIQWGILFHSAPAHFAIGTALGGAASNLYDLITRGAVLDFIDLGWWPVFNLADVAITCGVITALLV